jgi:hypothetical protein
MTWTVYLFLVVGNQVIDIMHIEERHDSKAVCEYHAITAKNAMATVVSALGDRVKVDQVLWSCKGE